MCSSLVAVEKSCYHSKVDSAQLSEPCRDRVYCLRAYLHVRAGLVLKREHPDFRALQGPAHLGGTADSRQVAPMLELDYPPCIVIVIA